MIREIILSLFITASAFSAQAGESTDLSDRLSSLIRTSLTEKISDTQIKIPSLKKLTSKKPMSDFNEIKTVQLMQDLPSGVAVFEVLGTTSDQSEKREVIKTPYEAWKKAKVATHRIYPNAKLKNEDFKIQEVNVASGVAREYRGVMLPADTDLSKMQSKQSILENQYVVLSAVEKQPDLKRGDTVKLELVSGDLTLTTQATAEESASVGDRVRVMTVKTKKEIIGKLKEDHSVEVML